MSRLDRDAKPPEQGHCHLVIQRAHSAEGKAIKGINPRLLQQLRPDLTDQEFAQLLNRNMRHSLGRITDQSLRDMQAFQEQMRGVDPTWAPRLAEWVLQATNVESFKERFAEARDVYTQGGGTLQVLVDETKRQIVELKRRLEEQS